MTKKSKKTHSAKTGKPEKPGSQIGRLATFITNEIPGEPSRPEGAVDTAIRLLRHAYGPEGLSVPYDPTAEEAVDRLGKFLDNNVPETVLDACGREASPADTAINLIANKYPHAVAKESSEVLEARRAARAIVPSES